ncbi:MAG: S-layer protein domain-containing protein [Methanosarcina sp.]|nr:S-layer protein domain-containing protein [Methanosarcina sp.]
MQADAFMRVPDKPGKMEDKETNFVSIFSFFLLISLCSSIVLYSVSPALAAENKEKLSIVLIDGGEVYIRSGNSHSFLQDYLLHVKGTDTEGKRIWIELSRKGVPLQHAIVTEGSQFSYSNNSTEILNLTVSRIYEGADGVLVKFSPVYQYLDPKLPMSQTPAETLTNASDNISFNHSELETQAKGFDIPLFLLGLGTVFLLTSFFAGKGKKK